jgi:hypothetical protein
MKIPCHSQKKTTIYDSSYGIPQEVFTAFYKICYHKSLLFNIITMQGSMQKVENTIDLPESMDTYQVNFTVQASIK